MVTTRSTSAPEQPVHRCEICPHTSSSYPEYFTHMRSHFNAKPYFCMVCGKRFGNPLEMNAHVEGHVVPDRVPVRCRSAPPLRPRGRPRKEAAVRQEPSSTATQRIPGNDESPAAPATKKKMGRPRKSSCAPAAEKKKMGRPRKSTPAPAVEEKRTGRSSSRESPSAPAAKGRRRGRPRRSPASPARKRKWASRSPAAPAAEGRRRTRSRKSPTTSPAAPAAEGRRRTRSRKSPTTSPAAPAAEGRRRTRSRKSPASPAAPAVRRRGGRKAPPVAPEQRRRPGRPRKSSLSLAAQGARPRPQPRRRRMGRRPKRVTPATRGPDPPSKPFSINEVMSLLTSRPGLVPSDFEGPAKTKLASPAATRYDDPSSCFAASFGATKRVKHAAGDFGKQSASPMTSPTDAHVDIESDSEHSEPDNAVWTVDAKRSLSACSFKGRLQGTYECDTCGRRFKEERTLTYHKVFH